MVAVLLIWVTPIGRGLATVTAKMAEPLPFTATSPAIPNVHVLPAPLFGKQDQPGVLALALNTVCNGTVSFNVTPVLGLRSVGLVSEYRF